MRGRHPLLLVIVVVLSVVLSSCSGRQQESPSPTDAKPTEQSNTSFQEEEASDSRGDEDDGTFAEADSGQVVSSLADSPIVGVWELSYYVYRETVDGVTYETVDEPRQDVYFYFHPIGHWTMSYDELLDFDLLDEDDFDKYSDWRVTGPSTGELGYNDEITTLTLSDDGTLTLHAEFGEDEGRVIPDRVLERYS